MNRSKTKTPEDGRTRKRKLSGEGNHTVNTDTEHAEYRRVALFKKYVALLEKH